MANIKIVSDGTPNGTQVFNEDGMPLGGVTRIEIAPITVDMAYVQAKITFEDVELLLEAEINAEETTMYDETPEDLAVDFEQERENAIKKGWQQPKVGGNRERMIAWINYWEQMAEHDRKVAAGDKDPGRPVVPHRSG